MHILITNDDGYSSNGIALLQRIAAQYADVVVMAPEHNASGLSHSFTFSRPLRVRPIETSNNAKVFACDGTPVDCVKIAIEHFCPKVPDLVLSGINHGSNAGVNVIYSGTMGAVIEASTLGIPAIGFSHLSGDKNADLSHTIPFINAIIANVLEHKLPDNISLNVNFPDTPNIHGLRVCRAAKGHWADSFEQRFDPHGVPYWWITGTYHCDEASPETDEYALAEGYASIVPTMPDYTSREFIPIIEKQFHGVFPHQN